MSKARKKMLVVCVCVRILCRDDKQASEGMSLFLLHQNNASHTLLIMISRSAHGKKGEERCLCECVYVRGKEGDRGGRKKNKKYGVTYAHLFSLAYIGGVVFACLYLY